MFYCLRLYGLFSGTCIYIIWKKSNMLLKVTCLKGGGGIYPLFILDSCMSCLSIPRRFLRSRSKVGAIVACLSDVYVPWPSRTYNVNYKSRSKSIFKHEGPWTFREVITVQGTMKRGCNILNIFFLILRYM